MNKYVDTHRYWNINCVIMMTAVAPKPSTAPSPSPPPPPPTTTRTSSDPVDTTVIARRTAAEPSTETAQVKVPPNGKMSESQTR